MGEGEGEGEGEGKGGGVIFSMQIYTAGGRGAKSTTRIEFCVSCSTLTPLLG